MNRVEASKGIRRRRPWGASVCCAIGMTLAIGLLGPRVSRATGVPEGDGALTYSGVLEQEDGTPLPDAHDVVIRLLADSGDVCESSKRKVTGQFSVSLPVACTSLVNGAEPVSVEVLVDGTSFEKAPIRAVPYALQASRATLAEVAMAPGPELEGRLADLETRLAAAERAARVVCGWIPTGYQFGTDPIYEFHSLCRKNYMELPNRGALGPLPACALAANHYCHDELGFAGGWFNAETPQDHYYDVGYCCAGGAP